MHKSSDGMYHISGNKYKILVGSRAQVWHGTAYKTTGGLTKNKLKKNKHGKIVSKAKSAKGPQMLKRLHRKGYFTRKGKWGYVKKSPVRRSSKYVAKRSSKRSSKRKRTVKRKKRARRKMRR